MNIPQGSHLNNPAVQAALQSLAQASQNMPKPALHVAHNVLNGGEISPEMLARFDQPRYQTGSEKLLNMVPMPQGGITKRPGLAHLGRCSGNRSRLFPFVFSAGECRMLELAASGGNSRLHVWFSDGRHVDSGLDIPYGENELDGLCMAQCGDVLYLAHPAHAPAKISRYSDADWRYAVVSWLPAIAAPVISSVSMAGHDSKQFKTYEYVATAVARENGEESVPGPVYVFNGYVSSDSYSPLVSISGVPGAAEYRIYKKRGGVFGYIGSLEADENGLPKGDFNDASISPDTEDSPPRAKDPFAGGNYPSLVFFHQQRLCFASSDRQPLTIWMSQSGNFESMAASLPPADDDAIEVTLATSQASRIVWCMSDRAALAVGTEGGEWLLSAAEGQSLSPSDLFFQPQTAHGSQPGLAPLMAGSGIVYMQRGGRVPRAYGYSFNSDKYESGDLSLLARHVLEKRRVLAWAWQAEPCGIVWCVLSDGRLAGLTYMPGQDVIAWHCHETAGECLDVAVIPGADGNSEAWFIVRRNGERCLEKLDAFGSGSPHLDGSGRTAFAARCIPCLPESQLQDGASFLGPRKINAVKARVIRSKQFMARVGDGQAMSVPARGAAYTEQHCDWALPLASGWRENDRLELIFDGPDPVTVLGIETVVEVADMSGGLK